MKNLILFLITFGITVLGIEFFLNTTRITPPTLKYYNPVYGSLNRPNIDYYKAVEGLYVGKTNYDGRFRENYPKRKDDKKTLRILLMGDSFVEGIDVFSHNHFARYMEELLGQKLNRKVEVIDFGRGNCAIQASSYYFTDYISKEYDADLVLYFTEWRDMYNIGGGAAYPSTCFILDSNNNLAAGYLWKKTPEYAIHKKLTANPILKHYESSAYFRLLYRAVAMTKITGMPIMTFGKFGGSMKKPDYATYTSNAPVSLLSKKLYDTVNSYDKGQVIWVVRNKPYNAPAILEYLKDKNFKYVSLSDTFNDNYIKGTNIDAYYFKASGQYGGHWNNDGHKAMGYFLTNRIYNNLANCNTPNYEK